VYAREIGDAGRGEQDIALACFVWHERKNDPSANAGGCEGERKNAAAVLPVEEMPLAKMVDLFCAQRGAGVKEAVTYIGAPGHEGQE
jgi:hypothetical protein